MVSDKKVSFIFSLDASVKHVTPGQANLVTHGFNLIKLGRGPLGDAKYQFKSNYQWSRPSGFRQEDFFTFSLYKPM